MFEPTQSSFTGISVIQGKLEVVRDLAVSLDKATKVDMNADGDVNWLGVAQEVHTDLNVQLAILEAELTALLAAVKGTNP